MMYDPFKTQPPDEDDPFVPNTPWPNKQDDPYRLPAPDPQPQESEREKELIPA